MGKIRKTTTYTKSIFNEVLGISLKLRYKNNKPIIVTKKKYEEDYSYYKFVYKNNKYYLVFQIFNPRMYALTKDYHSDTCTLQININVSDKKYKALTFTIIHYNQLSLSNIKMYSDCLYTRGAARVENYSTYLSKLSDILL